MKELPHTVEISLFGKNTLHRLKEKRCLIVDLTKLSTPNGEHFAKELERHYASADRRHFPRGIEKFEWRESASDRDIQNIIRLAGDSNVIIYGFHEKLPAIVKALTKARIKHRIVLSNTQHESMSRDGRKVVPNVHQFAKNLSEEVNGV
ncbi:MAG: hypothetical protein QXR53_00855 [Candidatus Norongarragalinales archaeon]